VAEASPDFFVEVSEADGMIQPGLLSDRLHINKVQLASALGLSIDAVTKQSRLRASRTQTWLREAVEILTGVRGWMSSNEAAFAWYRSAPIPFFGDMTAEDLVKQGRAEAVKRYLSRIAAGGFA
jgi:Protein of unknown function (DUF2384)